MFSAKRYAILLGFLMLACGPSGIAHEVDSGAEQPTVIDGGMESPELDAGMLEDDASVAAEEDAGTAAQEDAGHDVPLSDAGTPPVDERVAPMFGVTVTNPWAATESPALLATLATFESPTARVVFDSGVDRVLHTYDLDASSYATSVAAIGTRARVMGELLDSFFFPRYSVDQFRARACEYRASLGHLVDVWEIGNEINGEWLGPDVEAKLVAAIEVFRADSARFGALCPGYTVHADERPFELALTLYYNGEHEGGVATFDNCWANPEHAMLRWASSRMSPGGVMSAAMSGVDYVFVSFYEDDCHGTQPDWQHVFDELGSIVPSARMGIGECGTREDSNKPRYVERYYGGMDSTAPELSNMRVDHPRFVGGNFWWYLSDDLDQPAVLDALRASQRLPFWSRE